MNDAFLVHNLYLAISDLCREHEIIKIKRLVLTVNKESSIGEEILREEFRSNSSELINVDSEVIINTAEKVERYAAIIEYVGGEKKPSPENEAQNGDINNKNGAQNTAV